MLFPPSPQNYRTRIIKCVSFCVNLPHNTDTSDLNRQPDWLSAVDYSMCLIPNNTTIVPCYMRTTRRFSKPTFDLFDLPKRDTPSRLEAQQT
uniref:Uncharacterized protein n=1 Tax=Panagrellus redivivus TaxID=6233 RepID=A0A7E4V0C5_PANRE